MLSQHLKSGVRHFPNPVMRQDFLQRRPTETCFSHLNHLVTLNSDTSPLFAHTACKELHTFKLQTGLQHDVLPSHQIPKYWHAGCNICAQTHRREKHIHTELTPRATQLHLLQILSSSSSFSPQWPLPLNNVYKCKLYWFITGMKYMRILYRNVRAPAPAAGMSESPTQNGIRGPLSTITSSEKAITEKSAKRWMCHQPWNQWSREGGAQLLQWKPLRNF